MMCCGPSFPVATAFLVAVVLSMAAHTVEGWVLGARTSPFSNLEPVGSRRLSATEGNDFAARFRLADLSGPGGVGYDDDYGTDEDYHPYTKRSPGGDKKKYCGRMLDKIIRAVCRRNKGKREARSSGDILTSIFNPENEQPNYRTKRSIGATDVCCRRSCSIEELLQFC